MSIFNKNIPSIPTIIINEDFYEMIQSQIPPDSKIEEENEPTIKMANRIIKAEKPTEGTTIYEKKVI